MSSSSNPAISFKKNTSLTKKIIMTKPFAHEYMIDFEDIAKGTNEVEQIFEAQGWISMLKDIENVYHEKPLRAFYLNLSRPSLTKLESTINGKVIVIDTDLLSSVLHIPNEGKNVFFDKVQTSTLLRAYDENRIKEALLEEGISYTNKLSTTHLKALPDILLSIVRANLVQQMGHGSEVNNTQVAMLCSLIAREQINLPQLMIDQIWKSLNQSKHGLAYPALLTKIFKHLLFTTRKDEFNNYSPLNWINGRTFANKRRFKEIDDGYEISTSAVLKTSSSSSTSGGGSTTLHVTSGPTSSIPASSSLNISKSDFKRLDKNVSKMISYFSKISKMPGMPSFPSDDDTDED